jgi:hypothetical protein
VQVDGELYNDTGYSSDWDAVWKGALARRQGLERRVAIPLTGAALLGTDVQNLGLSGPPQRQPSARAVDLDPHPEQRPVGWCRGSATSRASAASTRTGPSSSGHYASAKVRALTPSGGALLGYSLGGTAEAGVDVRPRSQAGADLAADARRDGEPRLRQVEADQVVLNLTRFETFFPEKRPFFLEGREVFETPFTVFYPRRIGQPAVGLGPGGHGSRRGRHAGGHPGRRGRRAHLGGGQGVRAASAARSASGCWPR